MIKPQVAVIASSAREAVLGAGGRLFDLVTSGWDGIVITADRADPRPLRILGARVMDLEPFLSGLPSGWRADAIMAEAALYGSDERIRHAAYRARGEGLTGVMLWGSRPGGPDGQAGSVRCRLSAAARAFKSHAMAAAGLTADAANAEVFRKSGITPPDRRGHRASSASPPGEAALSEAVLLPEQAFLSEREEALAWMR
jgi:hypothetical protein